MRGFEKNEQGVVRLGGMVRAGERVSSKLQWCRVCGKMTAEKRLRVETNSRSTGVERTRGVEGGKDTKTERIRREVR